MWIFKGAEKGLEGVTGVPANDLTDEEFEGYNDMVNRQFTEQDALKNNGLYEHVADKPEPIRTRTMEREQPSDKEKDGFN